MLRFSLDMLISNLVDFSLCMTLNFGDKLRAQKKIRKRYCRLLLVGDLSLVRRIVTGILHYRPLGQTFRD